MVNYTRKKGGRYVGQGTYGCVFTEPPLKCKNQNSRNTRKVISKLLNREAANEEYIESQVWADIDPKQEFSIWADKYCKIDTNNIKHSDEMERCTVAYKNAPQSRRLIFYPYGGQDLHKLRPNSKNYINLFKGFANLLHGISIAHKNNIAHMDIKEPNIVVEVKYNEIIMRFIDFGLQIMTDEFNPNSYKNTMYKNVYIYWPYELAFYDRKTSIKNVNDHYDNFYENIKDSVYNYTQSNYFNERWSVKPVNEFINAARTVNLDNLFEKVDIFSLGVVLSRLVERYFGHVLGLNLKKENEIKVNIGTRKFISQTTDEDFYSKEEQQFHNDIATHITKPLLLLSQKMTSLDANKRPTAENALKEYKTFFNAFDKYLQSKKVYNGLAHMNIFDTSALDDVPMTTTPSVRSSKKSVKTASIKSIKEPNIKSSKVASVKPLPDNVPKTGTELKNIYKMAIKKPLELNNIVKIARALGSTLPAGHSKKGEFLNDIIRLAKEKYDHEYGIELIE
jgi:serine/threonine protein kinase